MSKKVLVVEDNPDMLFVLLKALDREGVEFVSVEEGKSAYATAVAEKPDVVVIDLVLPGQSGIEVGKAIRADARFKNVKLMGISGHVPSRAMENGLFDDFLEKPFDVSEMVTRVRALAGINATGDGRASKKKGDVVLPDESDGDDLSLTVHGPGKKKKEAKRNS